MTGLRRASRWVVRNLLALAFLLALAGLLVTGWSALARPLLNRKVVVYTGAASGDAVGDGRRIKEHFANAPWWPPYRYEVEVRKSDGLQENRLRVQEAGPDELVLGFDQDGFVPVRGDNRPAVTTLAELSESYLHVVVNPRDSKLPPAATLDDLIESHLRPAAKGEGTPWKVYLGPADSGSRQFSEAVLRYFRINPLDVDAGDHLSWRQAYHQLKTDKSNLLAVFDASELGSVGIAEHASDLRLRLVGLANPAGVSGGTDWRVNFRTQDLPAGMYAKHFCPAPLKTLTIRRLVVCPAHLPEGDAARLAAGIAAALSLTTTAEQPVARPRGEPLLIRPHPGAGGSAGYTLGWVGRVVSNNLTAVALWVSGFVLYVLRGSPGTGLFGKPAAPPTVTVVEPLPRRRVAGRPGKAAAVNLHDDRFPADKLTVTAGSSDPTVVPPAALRVNGTGATRSLTLSGRELKAPGAADVTLTVTNPDGLSATVTFPVRVDPPPSSPPPPPPPAPLATGPAVPRDQSEVVVTDTAARAFDDAEADVEEFEEAVRLGRTDAAAADALRSKLTKLRRQLGPDWAARMRKLQKRVVVPV